MKLLDIVSVTVALIATSAEAGSVRASDVTADQLLNRPEPHSLSYAWQPSEIEFRSIEFSYGNDDRHSYNDLVAVAPKLPAPFIDLASAVVTLVQKAQLHDKGDGEGTYVNVTTNGCAKEASLGVNTCSGMLITPTRVLTAAHCLTDLITVNGSQTPSDLSVILDRREPLQAIKDPKWRDIAKVPGAVGVTKSLYCAYDRNTDLAVVELLEPVEYKPVSRRTTAPVRGESVYLYATPSGNSVRVSICLPNDISCHPPHVAELGATYFRAAIDSARGSSGGGVVDAQGRLIGVLSWSPDHFGYNGNDCFKPIVYSEGCDGEVLMRIDGLPSELFDDRIKLPDVPCSVEPIHVPGLMCEPHERRRASLIAPGSLP